ncbi:tail fiber protein [Burkholderia phage BcepGomr]|uniref:tail fiber protein n=1 Tax=Burkholderia phage BcepGomr TaxID=437329 RepID=UPI00015034C0|nr:tail fiber protein [Burkholderia phage BcepGomr]ABP63590.1 BcepGomrgp19 [Burkholderia phage BcepGomr]
MATITYRGAGAWGAGKGSKLTNAEVDNNFYSLNQTKVGNDSVQRLTNGFKFSGGILNDSGTTGVSIGLDNSNSTAKIDTISAGATDSKHWRTRYDGTTVTFQYINDAWNASADWLSNTRSGMTCTAIWMGVRPTWRVSGTDRTPWDNGNLDESQLVRMDRGNTLRSAGAMAVTGGYVQNAPGTYTSIGVEGGVGGANAGILMSAGSRAADNRYWNMQISGNDLVFRTVNDAWSAENVWMRVTRSGLTISRLEYGLRPYFAGNLAWDAGNFNPGDYLNRNGGQVNGWVTINAAGATSLINIVADANQEKRIQFGNNNSGPNRWAVAVSGDNNAGDLYINRSDDAGNYVESPIVVRRSNGRVDIGNGGLQVWGNCAMMGGAVDRYFTIDTSANRYRAFTINTSGKPRWQWGVSGEVEGGGNNGSNFYISRWADDGTGLDTTFTINRASGQAGFNRNLVVRGNPDGAAAANLTLDSAKGQYKSIKFNAAGLQRWEIGCDAANESGNNNGTDWFLSRYNDAGAFIDVPFRIYRASGNVQIRGRTDGVAIPTGSIGEVLTFNSIPTGVPIGGSSGTVVLGVTIPAGVWLCTLRSILKNGGGAVSLISHAWQPPGYVGQDGYGAATRPKDGNWTTLTNTVVVRSSASILSQVSWYLAGDAGSADGTVDVTCVRIA